MTDLGTLGGSGNQAYGINANGDVVGFSSTADPGVHTFLSSGGFMLDLNDHVPADPAWVLREARAINDAGQIVGSGSIGGQTHAFLLTPMAVPEPSGYAIVTGVALLGYVAWRRRPAR